MSPEQWVLVLGAGTAVLAGLGTIAKMILDHVAGVRSREDSAEERHMSRLEKRVTDLEAQARLDADYITALLLYIAGGCQGPVPTRTTQ